MDISINENIIIENELMVSLGLIRHGLYYLYKEDGSEDMLFVFLQLASSGFERLLKLILTCKNKIDKGKFISDNELRSKYRHNLVNAWNDVKKIDNFSEQKYNSLDGLFQLFSEFGNQKRYENFNILGKDDKKYISYKEQFNDCVFSIDNALNKEEYTAEDMKKENIILIKKLFTLTKNLISILENVCSATKTMGILYKKPFNNFSMLLQNFDKNKISVFE